jgi:hypothetical protein
MSRQRKDAKTHIPRHDLPLYHDEQSGKCRVVESESFAAVCYAVYDADKQLLIKTAQCGDLLIGFEQMPEFLDELWEVYQTHCMEE